MLKLISFALMVIGGLTVASWFAEAAPHEARARHFDVEVAITGAHPAGKSWDGTRIFLLPWEVTTVTPPDLEICIVRLTQTRCVMDQRDHPICPDANRCKFDRLNFPIDEPFGIVVFDLDNFGEEALEQTTQAVRQTKQALQGVETDGVASMFGTQAANLFEKGMILASKFAENAADTLDETNVGGLEWIDAIILIPENWNGDRGAFEELSTRIRKLIAKSATITLMSSWKNRMRGRFEVKAVLDCTWPSPPCENPYFTFHFFSSN